MNKIAKVWLPIFTLFQLNSVECKTQYGPCSPIDEKILNGYIGQNFFRLSISEVQTSLSENPENGSIYIQRVFPNKLQIVIQKQKAYAGVAKKFMAQTSPTNGFFLISREGSVLSFSENLDLPKFYIDDSFENPVVGKKVDQKVRAAANLVVLTEKIEKARGAYLTQNDITLDIFPNGVPTKVIYPLDEEPAIVLGALQLILVQAKISTKVPLTIDLRYKNPVLTY